MKRRHSIERALKMHLWDPPYFRPSDVVPPRSVVRAKHDPFHDGSVGAGESFRVGFYSLQDGPNVVRLVDASGEYKHWLDQATLNEHFELVSRSDELDTYGHNRPILGPLA